MTTIQEINYSVALMRAILWEYNDAVNLQSILTQKQTWYDINQSDFWSDWYRDVFNLLTANDFGLSVWSIILGLPLQFGTGPDPSGKPIFGFGSETMTPNLNQNFENGNFSNNNFSFGLTTEEKRLLLRLRYFQLTSRTAIPEINKFLNYIFQGFPGTAYVFDGLDMTIDVIFTFLPSSDLRYILRTYDLIPRGAGVGVKYLFFQSHIFGFGSETALANVNENFENGDFLGENL